MYTIESAKENAAATDDSGLVGLASVEDFVCLVVRKRRRNACNRAALEDREAGTLDSIPEHPRKMAA